MDNDCVVSVQAEDFDVAKLQAMLVSGATAEGALVTFTGYVRGENDRRDVHALELEHYPGMTEASISAILKEAGERWPLLKVAVVHRIGKLRAGEQIVWVGVSSAHREAAFDACEFIMDYLKTRAPFWKKETGPGGANWVAQRHLDVGRAARWQRGGSQ